MVQQPEVPAVGLKTNIASFILKQMFSADFVEEETRPLARSGMTREGARGKPGELPASLYNEQSELPRSRFLSQCRVKGVSSRIDR